MRSAVLVLSVMVMPSIAHANEQIFVNAALFYSNDTVKYGDAKLDRTSLYSHFGAGMRLGSGVMLGGKYVLLDEDAKNDDTKSSNVLSAFGLSLGYIHSSGLGIMATHLLEPTREIEGGGDSTTTWSGGDGSVIDVGYYFDNGDWAIGPQFSIVNATFKTIESEGVEIDLDTPYEETLTYPYVSWFFYF